MHTVTSRDGTPIAYWRSGQGPPLLLVHGVIADHSTTWRLVLPELERRFTVYAVDRRGRGGSGDSSEYELQCDAEDIAAVIDAIAEAVGEPVDLLGHSFGGLCTLEAGLLTANLRRLVVYEGTPRHEPVITLEGIERLEAMLDAGDVEGMLIALLRDVVEMPPEEIEMLRSQRDAWAVRLANAPVLPRELRAGERYRFAPERFRGMRAPTLLLVGEASPPRELEAATSVADALPDARIVVLPDVQHLAMYTAPDIFVGAVVRFLEEG